MRGHRLNALIWYNAWPEHPVMERWEHRFDWLGRWLCCNIGMGHRPASPIVLQCTATLLWHTL